MQTFEHYAVALILVRPSAFIIFFTLLGVSFSYFITNVFSFVEQLEAVTVNPLAHICPTNKIAPRRKRYDSHPRTFGQFYNLLTPNSPSSLQENPQEDAPDDCGEIEDYDENDIGSVTQRPIRRQGYQRTNLKKGSSNSHRPSNQHLLNQHNHYGIKPPVSNPTRPPPAGYFGTNNYTPQKPQEPSDYVKPVNEAGQDHQTVYRPGLVVGGPLYHVVGLPQSLLEERPQSSGRPSEKPNNREPKYHVNHAYVPATHSNSHANHRRPRKYNSDTGILGSFVDLFF